MQTLEIINVGQAPNDGSGDDHRKAFQKVNANFDKAVEGIGEVAAAAQEAAEAAETAGQLAADAVPSDAVGVAGGVAPLDSAGKVPGQYLPEQEEFIPMAQKGAADGVATLGSDGKVTPEQLPNAVDAIPLAQKGEAGGVATLDNEGQVPAAQLGLAVPIAQKGAAGGVAQLDSASRLPTTQLPAVTQSLWNGTTLTLGADGRWIRGNFDGAHAADTASIQTLRASTPTYLPIVPGAGADSSYVICRNAAGPNSAFVALGMNGSVLMADLTFSRHGTAGIPGALRIFSASTECGRIGADGAWILGPYLWVPNVTARQHVYYTGGGSMYGTAYRGQAQTDGVAIQFQAYNGAVAGYIQSNFNLSVTYATTSDYRSKHLLGPVEPAVALENVMKLRPVHFRMNGVAVVMLPLNGFVAHELQEVIPQAVTGYKDQTRIDDDGNVVPVMQGVDLSKVVPTLVAAMQAQQGMIDELTRQVGQLRDELARVLQE